MKRSKTHFRPVDGILLFDKAAGLTSNAALQQVRHLYRAAKAGHTGSLDPLATGLLPICFGEATKLSQYLTDADKRYQATLVLGQTTTTGDSEGEIVTESAVTVTRDEIQAALEEFIGHIEQVPPMYSALKRDGQPLYKLARQGIEVQREARPVEVRRLNVLDLCDSRLVLDMTVSKGFYVRSLAFDLGERLGCGAHVSQLRRTAVGGFSIDQAHDLATLEAMGDTQRLALLLSPDQGLRQFPAVEVPIDAAHYLRQGQSVRAAELPSHGLVRLYGGEGEFLGIGQVTPDRRVAPKRIFNLGR